MLLKILQCTGELDSKEFHPKVSTGLRVKTLIQTNLPEFLFSKASAKLQATFAFSLASANIPEARSPGYFLQIGEEKITETKIHIVL